MNRGDSYAGYRQKLVEEVRRSTGGVVRGELLLELVVDRQAP